MRLNVRRGMKIYPQISQIYTDFSFPLRSLRLCGSLFSQEKQAGGSSKTMKIYPQIFAD